MADNQSRPVRGYSQVSKCSYEAKLALCIIVELWNLQIAALNFMEWIFYDFRKFEKFSNFG